MGGQIDIAGDMKGARIQIDGALKNNVTTTGHYEIETAGMEDYYDDTNEPPYSIEGWYYSAVVVNYDGYDDNDDDTWATGAEVLVGTTSYGDTHAALNIWRVRSCVGDLNCDTYLTAADVTVFTDDLLDAGENFDPNDYYVNYPGLEGSLDFHAMIDADNDIDAADRDALNWMITEGCTECTDLIEYNSCWADLDKDGDVDLSDLAVLLGNYGTTSGMTRDDGDLYGADGAVNISDLAELLARYGDTCACFDTTPPTGGRRSLLTSYVDVTVDAIDTNGHTGGGFVGEVDHFVFDLQIEVDDPNTDDWVATGADLESDNDAEFRLSIAAAYPSQYATFVSAPWTTLPGSATANIAGAYDPPDPNEAFTTTDINIGWYDNVSSNDGPATVMRIVIDVGDVTDADVSEGFGSVYFSTSGPTGKDDILVATLSSETATAESAPGMKSFSGNFYVKGE